MYKASAETCSHDIEEITWRVVRTDPAELLTELDDSDRLTGDVVPENGIVGTICT